MLRVDLPTLQRLGDTSQPEAPLPPGTGVAFHSGRVRRGDVFFAMPGAAGHGLEHAAEALERGAAFVVSDLPHPQGVVVADPATTLLALGRSARDGLRARVIGVTGSVGKTSTKAMLRATLAANATAGNLNTPYALAATLVDAAIAEAEARSVGAGVARPLVLELGIDHVGEMAELLALTRPDDGVLTSVAASHLLGLRDLDTVAREKGKLLQATTGLRLASWRALGALRKAGMAEPEGGPRITAYHVVDEGTSGAEVGVGSPPVGDVGQDAGPKPGSDARSYVVPDAGSDAGPKPGSDSGSDAAPDGCVIATRTAADADGQTLLYGGLRLRLPWPGRGMASNALAALVAAERLGVDLAEAGERLLTTRLEPGRLERKRIGGLLVLDDTYNSNPASAEVAIEVLRSAPGPRVAVLGDMLELGPEAASAHAELGERTLGLDLVIAVGPAALDVLRGNPDALHAPDLAAATGLLERLPASGSVLFKASRGMGLERLVAELAARRRQAGVR